MKHGRLAADCRGRVLAENNVKYMYQVNVM
jgi:hypothetical protein